jgi:hypothetical protein
LGGILTGWFIPTEAGVIAMVYILVVVIPALNGDHLKRLPRDFAHAGLIYSLPLITIGAASAFGWMLAYLRGPIVVSGGSPGSSATTRTRSCSRWSPFSRSSATLSSRSAASRIRAAWGISARAEGARHCEEPQATWQSRWECALGHKIASPRSQ